MKHDFSGKRVVVVGGGSRIGRALAVAAAECGAEVVVAGRDPVGLEESARMADAARVVQLDLTDPTSLEGLGDRLGPIDHLVSTVSMHATGRVRDLDDHDMQRAIEAKILGPLRLVRHTVDAVRADGSYVFFSGMAAWRPGAGAAVTAAVNGGLAFLGPALAVELAPLRVNVIAPGAIDSGVLDRLDVDERRAAVERLEARSLAGRLGAVDEVVEATLMVMGNGYVNGTVVHVNGGLT